MALKRRILLIQLRQLGDILLTTPCLRAIKAVEPESHITFLSHKMGQLVLEGNPFLDELYLYDPNKGLLEEMRLARTLRSRGFDVAIDFMNNPRSALYAFASGARERIGFRSARRWAYTDTAARPDSSQYIVDQKFKLLELAGVKPSPQPLTLPWFEGHAGPMLKFLGDCQEFRDARLRVILSPTHRREVRRWGLANYARLADKLTSEWQACVTWLWGPGEEGLIDEVMAMCSHSSHKAPPTNFREMAAFLANHDLFVGNSNGPSHVAVAAGVPSLQIHGHTAASSWCPMNELHSALQSPSDDISEVSFDMLWNHLCTRKQIIQNNAEHRQGRPVRIKWTV